MKKAIFLFIIFLISHASLFSQDQGLENLNFIIGKWEGKGSGFGDSKSKIVAEYQFVMEGKYIQTYHESQFENSEDGKPGDHHVDMGFISYDKIRNKLVYRQFNNEGYVNQYILIDSLSNNSSLIFETENIENFMPGGKARWTINKKSDKIIETIFDVLFPGGEYTCFGTNVLKRVDE